MRFFKIYCFTMAVISIVALCKVFAGQVYTREPRTVADIHDASTINSTSWPFKMRLRMIYYVCPTPTSSFGSTEEELIAAWDLPPETRLSDRMRKVARCHLAARRISSDFDPNQCDCVDQLPIGLVLSPLILNACFYSFRFAFGLPMDKSQNVRKLYWISGVLFELWLVTLLCNVVFNLNVVASFLYTRYGYTKSSLYFDAADWIRVLNLLFIGLCASAAEVFYRAWVNGGRRRAINRVNTCREWFVRFIDFVQALRG